MFDAFGWGSWLGLAVIGFLALCLAGLAIAMARMRRRKAQHDEPVATAVGRLALVESTELDSARRLLLVRCDDIEHLILIGGPADLVVENDVRRRRAAARPGAKPAATAEASRPAPTGRTGVPAGPPPTPAGEPDDFEAAFALARLPAEPLPAARAEPRNGQAAAANGARTEGARTDGEERQRRPAASPELRISPQVPEPAARDNEGPRRDAVGKSDQPSSGHAAPAPGQNVAVAGPPDREKRGRLQPLRVARREGGHAERRARAERAANAGREEKRADLPPAETPWAEPGSLESEIVRAIRVEPQPPLAPAPSPVVRQPLRETPPAARSTTDPSTTLGDLAERLEEALAREVQSAGAGRPKPDHDMDFGFARERDRAEQRVAAPNPPPVQVAAPQRERPDPPRVMAPVPEPEPRREARASAERSERPDRQDRPERPERSEETPVISLNARRREPVDPLEDEMARLLGELTGDTTRR
jgi:hypothetical protein